MSYTVGVGFHFSAGHTLHNHLGKCRNAHGHNYHGELMVVAGNLDIETGMVIDFDHLKIPINKFVETVDHKFLVYDGDPRLVDIIHFEGVRTVDYIPTVENIAKTMKDYVNEYMRDSKWRDQFQIYVKLYETENCYAEV